ncbi:MAG TPA: hypothetical protein VI137_01485 [Pseudolabrys sp.]
MHDERDGDLLRITHAEVISDIALSANNPVDYAFVGDRQRPALGVPDTIKNKKARRWPGFREL